VSLAELDATALAAEHARGQRGVRDTLEETLAALAELGPGLGALSEVLADSARKRADVLDTSLQHGFPPGALCGVPVVLKSNLCQAGVETACGSRVLAGYRPPYDATVVERLLAAGAIPVATAHMDEFAMGSSGENSAYSSARNPWDPTRTPGGSSSGCAAVVAAGLVPLALGSDTGGSVRQPAALCGIAGFKPTYGRFSRYGLVAFGSSLDQVGPLARSVRDLELVLEELSGPDARDATTLPDPPVKRVEVALEGLRIGVPAEYFGPGLDERVRARVGAALEELESLGARCVPISLPGTELAIACYYVIATAEAASNLARFDGVRFGQRRAGDGTLAGMQAATRAAGFGPEVKRRILLGTFVLSRDYQEAWYGRALAVRTELAAEFEAAFASVDLIAGPTSPDLAFRLGERSADPLAMYLSDALTVPASLAGLPAVSVPVGCAGEGASALPVGLQMIAPRGADARLLAAARRYQESTAHHHLRPALAGA
jgi:aspartyl-tRNA(Asn)/glutamyl-tRNA(Gln) amidotransferase subunit A